MPCEMRSNVELHESRCLQKTAHYTDAVGLGFDILTECGRR